MLKNICGTKHSQQQGFSLLAVSFSLMVLVMLSMSLSTNFLEPRLVLRALSKKAMESGRQDAAISRISLLSTSSLYLLEYDRLTFPIIGDRKFVVNVDGSQYTFAISDDEGTLDIGIGTPQLLQKIIKKSGNTLVDLDKLRRLNHSSHLKGYRYILQGFRGDGVSENRFNVRSKKMRLNFSTVSTDLLKLLSSKIGTHIEMKTDIGAANFYAGSTRNIRIQLVSSSP
jgi:hypothetical protein